jgi:hypothetical protein
MKLRQVFCHCDGGLRDDGLCDVCLGIGWFVQAEPEPQDVADSN